METRETVNPLALLHDIKGGRVGMGLPPEGGFNEKAVY